MAAPIPLRAHLVLCLLGFRGEGYSVEFISEMSKLLHTLEGDPETPVRLLTEPDRVCRVCPNLLRGGCTLGGPRHEAHMRRHDQDVLDRIGLAPGAVYSWALVKHRIQTSITGADLPKICTTCPWLPLGYCQEGVDALRAEAGELAQPHKPGRDGDGSRPAPQPA